MLFRPILRLVGFFPTSCSPHGLVLTSDPTFTKHELFLIRLIIILTHCHTLLSPFPPAINSRQANFFGKFSNLALIDDRNSRCRRSPDTEFQRHSKVRLITEKLY